MGSVWPLRAQERRWCGGASLGLNSRSTSQKVTSQEVTSHQTNRGLGSQSGLLYSHQYVCEQVVFCPGQ